MNATVVNAVSWLRSPHDTRNGKAFSYSGSGTTPSCEVENPRGDVLSGPIRLLGVVGVDELACSSCSRHAQNGCAGNNMACCLSLR